MATIFTNLRYSFSTLILSAALIMPALAITANAGGFSNARTQVTGSAPLLTNRSSDIPQSKANLLYHYTRGEKHFTNHDYHKAARAFRRVLRDKPQDANANFYMARIMSSEGNFGRAITHYKKALNYYQDEPILLAGLGISYAKKNKHEQAAKILVKLELTSDECDNSCETAPRIAGALHILSEALHNL